MHTQQAQVLLGTRIPFDLKEKLSKYCLSHGVKMSYLVTEAIKEKLLEIAEDNQDIAVVQERLKTPEFISQIKLDKYLLKRGIKS